MNSTTEEVLFKQYSHRVSSRLNNLTNALSVSVNVNVPSMSQLNSQELTRKFFALEACIDCLLKQLIAATH